ncbi:DUF3196 family protein [Spiroplasma platyhelix]|uniref:DUF3196 family protein n=1 Tax=Spiroplasma platyhelix PALS-1 TaxID=1276218 RepID=A0A846U2N0_9MOLU|nr:DUF3196 family protein [Spiroplasma platyhelix]MBE4704407.1 hypothetical protein [Spiroplasma platyhelix PALS-1]NKE38779.1 DUF3196 family protein [Spiroplasma platyhelix PALS-1]UJB28990.1 hypothetical protein SPLAT_v1c02250 [Spiroplasma platyhelix PALS-1]
MDNYYHEIIAKINHLISKRAWDQALILVQEELAVTYIPKQYQEQFEKLYSDIVFNLKMVQENKEAADSIWPLAMISKVISNPLEEEQHPIAFYHLQNYNVRLILPVIIEYLLNPNISNINKTRLVMLLKNQGIKEEFQVVKSHGTFSINPIKFPLWYDLKIYQNISKLLEQKVYSENPSLFQICGFLLNNYFESLMPKVPNLKHTNAIAAAIYVRACSLQFIRVTLLSSTKMFHSTSELIKKYLLDLNQHKIT